MSHPEYAFRDVSSPTLMDKDHEFRQTPKFGLLQLPSRVCRKSHPDVLQDIIPITPKVLLQNKLDNKSHETISHLPDRNFYSEVNFSIHDTAQQPEKENQNHQPPTFSIKSAHKLHRILTQKYKPVEERRVHTEPPNEQLEDVSSYNKKSFQNSQFRGIGNLIREPIPMEKSQLPVFLHRKYSSNQVASPSIDNGIFVKISPVQKMYLQRHNSIHAEYQPTSPIAPMDSDIQIFSNRAIKFTYQGHKQGHKKGESYHLPQINPLNCGFKSVCNSNYKGEIHKTSSFWAI